MPRAQETREVAYLEHSVSQRISASLGIEILDTPSTADLSRLYNPTFYFLNFSDLYNRTLPWNVIFQDLTPGSFFENRTVPNSYR